MYITHPLRVSGHHPRNVQYLLSVQHLQDVQHQVQVINARQVQAFYARAHIEHLHLPMCLSLLAQPVLQNLEEPQCLRHRRVLQDLSSPQLNGLHLSLFNRENRSQHSHHSRKTMLLHLVLSRNDLPVSKMRK